MSDIQTFIDDARRTVDEALSELDEVWPDVIPLDRVEHPDPLDMRLVPFADVVSHVSDVVQVPPIVTWGIAVSVLATAIGRRAKVKLPAHIEPSPIWTCSILPPGSRKSGVFSVMVKPISDIEAELQEAWHAEWLMWRAEADLAEAAIQALKSESKKKGADRRALAMQLVEEKRVLEEEPVKPLLYLTDTTTEALRKVLHEQGSIGLLSAEGASVTECFGRYNGNRGADMSLFLLAHAGDQDKGGRVGGTYGVREALATVGITAQPDVLKAIGSDTLAQGRGLVDRLLFLVPEDPRGTRTYRGCSHLSEAIASRWAGIIRFIMREDPPETPALVGVSSEAGAAWVEFAEDIEARQKEGGDLRYMSGFASKLAGAVGRIALAYHFAQGKDSRAEIDQQTMLQAIGMGVVLIDHAKAARQLMGEDAATARARQVLAWLQRNGRESVKPRDVVAAGAGGCKSAEEAKAACRKLEAHGYLVAEEVEHTGPGRKQGELWLLNRRVDLAQQIQQTQQNSPETGVLLDSLDLLGGVEPENRGGDQ